MSHLPINPTDEQLNKLIDDQDDPAWDRVCFQAGVEAERARAAAEATEEWGVTYLEDIGDPTQVEEFSFRISAQVWAARMATCGGERVVVRRTVGPWEATS